MNILELRIYRGPMNETYCCKEGLQQTFLNISEDKISVLSRTQTQLHNITAGRAQSQKHLQSICLFVMSLL